MSRPNHSTALLVCLIAAAGLTLISFALVNRKMPRVGRQPDGSYIVPTGQALTPAGTHIEVNDRPLGMALSPDGGLPVVVTGSNFAPRRIHVIDRKTLAVTQSIVIGDSFVGVAFSPDGQMLYVGGGGENHVKIYSKVGPKTFALHDVVPIAGSAPSGLSVSPDGRTLYVALNRKHALAVIDTKTRRVREVPVGSFPYTTLATPDGAKVYVSNWGGRRPEPGDVTDGVVPVVVDPETGIVNNGTISVLDVKSRTVRKNVEVGLHPSGMALSADGQRLYVANANSDSISVIDAKTDAVVQTIDVRLYAKAPLGSAPNAIAVSADGATLYVANAANNAVAVVDPARKDAPVRGFIPTGWFPAAVALSADGQQLFVANGYGFGSIAPTGRPGRRYSDRMGVISVLPVPDAQQLAAYTEQVLRNNRAPVSKDKAAVGARAGNNPKPQPIPMNLGQASPIKHVFYIIKENRTYDQVFGDLPQGNGDPALVQFGRAVTPNQHALAEQYVLLDNFYSAGDQSALGHRWCDEGYANDYIHKYGNGRNESNPMNYAPSGFLWDHARRHGKTVRIYGELASTVISPASATWTDIYNDWRKGTHRITFTARPRVAGQRDIISTQYPSFQLKITDQIRADVFLQDFRDYVAKENLPDLIIIALPDNHTNGTAPQYPTPRAMVADNDLALGRIVEAISQSRYWAESAIFVLEDDAQNGLDHVDGHRTVGMIFSPYAQRGAVDSTLYTTVNMFRTIEQILGLPPLNQFDLAAEPMFSAFTDQPDLSPYKALPNQIPLDEMNPGVAGLTGLQKELALESMKMDFSEPDEAPEDLLNRVIWHSVKGYRTPYPAGRLTHHTRP